MSSENSQKEVKELTRKRGTVKAKLTNFEKFMQSIQGIIDKKCDISSKQVEELKIRTRKMCDIYQEFDEIQSQIELICDEDSLAQQYNEREEFENSHSSLLASAQVIISDLGDTLTKNETDIRTVYNDDALSTHSNSHSLGNMNNIQAIKLPTIDLPKFNGSHTTWLEYKDTFESLIHSNASITNIQKYHYLRASLTGEAIKVIQSLEFSTDNYIVAWELLCKRFDNPRLLVHNHVKSIFDLDTVTKESAKALRSLIDNMNKHLRSLQSLGQPTDQWDTLLLYIITTKLDKTTAKEWEKHRHSNHFPNLEDMKQFLSSRADLLETLEINHGHSVKTKEHIKHFSAVTSNIKCNLCKKPHKIYYCEDFLKLSIKDRLAKVTELKLCKNCLNQGHLEKNCKSGHCKMCTVKHNSLLHENPTQVTMSCYSGTQLVLLSTIVVSVNDSKNNTIYVRALLDSGSQSCFISKRLHNFLGIEQSKTNISVVGINKGVSNINYKCDLTISSKDNKFSDKLTCLIVPQITDKLPNFQFDISSWEIPSHIELADPEFNKPHEINLLIGASHFWKLLKPNSIQLGSGLPILQDTVFGYIVSGSLNLPIEKTHCNFSKDQSLTQELRKFWEIEEVSFNSVLSKDDLECEKYFLDTLSRNKEGRFVVRIPLKYPASYLGNSKDRALHRFHNTEKKLQGNHALRKQYTEFMSEYQKLGHMSRTTEDAHMSYFLPHHPVFRNDSITTKIRIVFDGSATTESGWSLNDLQYTGPPILNDILPILLRFRQHNFVVCADIEKMYRQILVHENDRHLQQILWRSNVHEPIGIYKLNTVTYGTKSAPFLAIRCLKQLADEVKEQYPIASKIILSDFYVDDLITGFQTEEQAISIAEEIRSILLSAGFPLRKWNSNSNCILHQLREDTDPINLVSLGDNEHSKTLGLRWVTHSDHLTFHINELTHFSHFTKRNILSDISKLFDPLGLVSPCILISKLIIRSLWSLQVNWDDFIPNELETRWSNFRTELPLLNELQIKRQCISPDAVSVELHGFCDASTHGYGAVIYLRSTDKYQNNYVHLLCAKTKVAPLKTLTVPRLELCGAVMLARLSDKVVKSLSLQNSNCFLWCDSQIVLCWIRTQSKLLQTFVSNRVTEIQQLTKVDQWHYIKSESNPADIASRGALPKTLLTSQLWWHGPHWLKFPKTQWEILEPTMPCEVPEIKKTAVVCISTFSSFISITSFSSLPKLKNVTAYLLRFISNCKLPLEKRIKNNLTVQELSKGWLLIIKLAQLESFSDEIQTLNSQSQLKMKNRLLSLSPFLDSNGILRVGGRIKRSELNSCSKHPILLSGKHHLTKLLFEHYHKLYCHAPPQLLLSIVRQEYWPTSGMNVAKGIVRNCIKCFRAKPRSINPVMADLPKERVTVSAPFNICGLDYAGPFSLRDKKGRGCKLIKSYVCLFICFVTKAIHLEVISDLTSENFISALRRFTSRRGKPLKIYSDNALNFVGAKNELASLEKFLSQSKDDILNHCISEGISWNFIPPRSPHFGGIWEANIKQFKYHLIRVVGNTKLTYEEFTTIVVQIEGILNSRPLYPMSSDPNDFQPLTPSHFLIGKPLITIPDPSLEDTPMSRLSRFQLMQRINQDFWKSWSRDYLSSLQQRTKWRHQMKNVKTDTLVILKNDNSPPCSWPMGRIIKTYPDNDGIVRIVDVKTPSGVFRRAVTRICPLPLDDDPVQKEHELVFIQDN